MQGMFREISEIKSCRDNHNWTPLHCAAVNGHTKICELLLASGGEGNAVTDENATVTHYLARSHFDEFITPKVFGMLLKKGIDLDAQNVQGENFLQIFIEISRRDSTT